MSIIRLFFLTSITILLILLEACSDFSTSEFTISNQPTTTNQWPDTSNTTIHVITHTQTAKLTDTYIVDDNGFKSFENIQPPYSAGTNLHVSLIENKSAINPTWENLLEFVTMDSTDKMTYIDSFNVCSNFAQTLHNNAEKAGIRSAWVYIGLNTYANGHACNAFMTTDKGLVFVDCTGGRLQALTVNQSNYDYDKISYICIGKDYGMISIDNAASPKYSFYTEYMSKATKYREDCNKYNLEAQQYINELGGRIQLPEPDYSYFMDWHNKLDAEKTRLEDVLDSIGNCTWQSLGVVNEIKIYW
jgi:hypothetical protein